MQNKYKFELEALSEQTILSENFEQKDISILIAFYRATNKNSLEYNFLVFRVSNVRCNNLEESSDQEDASAYMGEFRYLVQIQKSLCSQTDWKLIWAAMDIQWNSVSC